MHALLSSPESQRLSSSCLGRITKRYGIEATLFYEDTGTCLPFLYGVVML